MKQSLKKIKSCGQSVCYCRHFIRNIAVAFVGLFLLIENTIVAEEVKITASDAAPSDEFGYSVSISGDYAIVGAHLDDDVASNSGSAYIFVRSGGNWSQQAKLTASDADVADHFGWSVSISGDFAIVGAYQDNVNTGSAYIFERSGSSWSQQAKLTAEDAEAGDWFGYSVSISGDYAVVGTPLESWTNNAGAAYVFIRSGSNWTQQAKLTASDGEEDENFGNSVSISGSYIIVGTYHDDDGGSNSGSAYIFERSGSSWSQQAKLTASDAAAGDLFGYSVSISKNYAIAGAYKNDDAGSSSGSAYVFVRSDGNWSQQQKLTANDPAAGDNFGRSVSISGSYIFIGAPYDDDDGSASGSGYSFLRNGSNWLQTSKITANDAATQNYLGWSVAIDGDYAITGAYQEDEGGSNSGSAYIYQSTDDLSLPVELSSFEAIEEDGQVTLKWTTESEINNQTFLLERSSDGEIFDLMAEIKGQGSTSDRTTYQYVDQNVINGITYYYRLSDRDLNGIVTYHSVVKATPNDKGILSGERSRIVEKFNLYPNYPNPFNPETTIRFDIITSGADVKKTKLLIFNISGKFIKTLFNESLSGGEYQAKWTGKNEYDVLQPSGVYYVYFQSEYYVKTRKIILLR